jgi:tryptophanyl-tRNA synthetase
MTGLFVYPVLMAADILIYKATHVPVGDDQKQHVEFARDIAQAFNNYTNKNLLVLPEPIIKKESARIMSLRDGLKKMSKSDVSDYSRIHLLDDSETIALKIRKAKTDAEPIPDNVTALENRPEAKNLLGLYSMFAEQSFDAILKQFSGKLFSEFKPLLADCANAHLNPIREKMLQLLNNKNELIKILTQGADAANNLAEKHITEIRQGIDLVLR